MNSMQEGSDDDTRMLIRIWNGLVEAAISSKSQERKEAILEICLQMLRLPNQQIELAWTFEKVLPALGRDGHFLGEEKKLQEIGLEWERARGRMRRMGRLAKLWQRAGVYLGLLQDAEGVWEKRYYEQLAVVNSLLSRRGNMDIRDFPELERIELPGLDKERIMRLMDGPEKMVGRGPGHGGPPERLDGSDIETIEVPDPENGGVLRILYSANSSYYPGAETTLEEYVSQIMETPPAMDSYECPPSSGRIARMQIMSALLDSSSPPPKSEPQELLSSDILSVAVPRKFPSSGPPKRGGSGIRATNK